MPWQDSPLGIGELRTLPVDESWYILGQALGVSHEELDRIQRSEANPFKCKTKMLKTWIHGDPTSSWGKVVAALEKIGRSELAAELRYQHGIGADSVSSSSGYSSTESSLLQNKVIEEDLDEMHGLKHVKLRMVSDFMHNYCA